MHPDASRMIFEEEVGRWPPDLAAACGWKLNQVAYPEIDCTFIKTGRTPLRLRLSCEDWDDQPPSILLLNEDGEPLKALAQNPTGVFHNGPHPKTGRPFICMAGSREFHTHPSHLNETWAQFRGKAGFSLGNILTKVWHAWLKGRD